MQVRRLSYGAFKALFFLAWLLLAGAVLSVAGHLRAGFLLFVATGLLLSLLGGSLALDLGQLSSRMFEQVGQRWSLRGQPLSMSRFGGIVMLAIGFGCLGIGLIGFLN
jgi:hypothetical protein